MESLMGRPKKARIQPEPKNSSLELKSLLVSRGIDITRYEPIGAGFYHQYEDCFNASVICIDRVKFMQGVDYMVKIILDDFTNEEYTRFRKNFEVIINPEYRSYYNLNISNILLPGQIRENLM